MYVYISADLTSL